VAVKEEIGRRRYILFKIKSKEKIRKGEIIRALLHSTTEKNIARKKAKIWLIELKPEEGKICFGIVRCSHLYKEKLTELLNSIENLGQKKVKLETIVCSGTLKKTRRKMKEIMEDASNT